MAVRPELGRLSKQAATEPGTVPLPLVRNNLETSRPPLLAPPLRTSLARMRASTSCLISRCNRLAEILVERAATGQNDVLVETPSDIDRGGLDHPVDDVGQGRQEVGAVDLGVEEDFGGEEALVADIDGDLGEPPVWRGDGVLDEAGGVAVVAGELLDDIGADVAVLLLESLGRSWSEESGSPRSRSERLDEVGNVTTSDGDRLDGRSDNVALSDGDDVGHTVTRVNDRTGQRPVLGTLEEVQEAARARTACTAMYMPAQLK